MKKTLIALIALSSISSFASIGGMVKCNKAPTPDEAIEGLNELLMSKSLVLRHKNLDQSGSATISTKSATGLSAVTIFQDEQNKFNACVTIFGKIKPD